MQHWHKNQGVLHAMQAMQAMHGVWPPPCAVVYNLAWIMRFALFLFICSHRAVLFNKGILCEMDMFFQAYFIPWQLLRNPSSSSKKKLAQCLFLLCPAMVLF